MKGFLLFLLLGSGEEKGREIEKGLLKNDN